MATADRRAVRDTACPWIERFAGLIRGCGRRVLVFALGFVCLWPGGGNRSLAAESRTAAPQGEQKQITIRVDPSARVEWRAMVARQRTLPASRSQGVILPPRPPNEKRLSTGRRAADPAPAISGRAPAGPLPGTVFRNLPGDSFDANLDDDTSIPPDTMGAVGPNHLMAMTNQEVRIWDKSGSLQSYVTINVFWDAGGCNGLQFDPRVHYDPLSDRWFGVILTDPDLATSRVCFAVSAGNDPTGTWSIYTFNADDGELSGTLGLPIWADFPGQLGMNDKWIPITANMFTTGCPFCFPAATKMWVIDKTTALAGGTLTVTVFLAGFDLGIYSDCDNEILGSFTMQPAFYYEPSDDFLFFSNTFLADDTLRVPLLRLSQLTGTAAAPSWSAVVPATGEVCQGSGFFEAPASFGISASDLGNNSPYFGMIDASQADMDPTNDPAMGRVDTGDSRVSSVVYRNGRLWAAHIGGLPCCGVADADRTAIFWYEMDPQLMSTTGVPFVQTGIIDGGVDAHYTYPSIAVNAYDEMLLGFSRSDPSRYVEAAFTGRLPSDPPGTVRSITTFQAGLDKYVRDAGSGSVRWGDYSSTVVDPTDDSAFWTIQEYAHDDLGVDPADDRFRTVWARIIPSRLRLWVSDTGSVEETDEDEKTTVFSFPFPALRTEISREGPDTPPRSSRRPPS